jgi:hypothetical protein
VHDLGVEAFAKEVEAEWQSMKDGGLALDPEVFAEIAARFRYPAYEQLDDSPLALVQARRADRRFDTWVDNAVTNHKVPGYAIVTLSLKPQGGTPGDATAEQMQAIADLAERYSFGEIRVGHEQNLVLPHVAQRELAALWRALDEVGLATPNVGLVSDIIACPGLDYCSLANARSIPVTQEIASSFRNLDVARDLGRLHINISRLQQCLIRSRSRRMPTPRPSPRLSAVTACSISRAPTAARRWHDSACCRGRKEARQAPCSPRVPLRRSWTVTDAAAPRCCALCWERASLSARAAALSPARPRESGDPVDLSRRLRSPSGFPLARE